MYHVVVQGGCSRDGIHKPSELGPFVEARSRDHPHGTLLARVSVMYERQNSGAAGGDSGSELRGTVKWFNPEKGFGFVSPSDGSPDVFLHISALKQAGLQDAPEGSTIHCEVGQGRKGIQVLRVIQLDTSTATPRAPKPRRPFQSRDHDRG